MQTVIALRECIKMLEDDEVPVKAKNDFLKQIVDRIEYSNDTAPYVLPNKPQLEIFLRG